MAQINRPGPKEKKFLNALKNIFIGATGDAPGKPRPLAYNGLTARVHCALYTEDANVAAGYRQYWLDSPAGVARRLLIPKTRPL